MAAFACVEVDIPRFAAVDIGTTSVHTNRTADRVAAKQKALRAAQYFRTLYVIQAGNGRPVASLVQIVLEYSGRWIAANAKVLGTNATYAHGIDETVLAVARDARRE